MSGLRIGQGFDVHAFGEGDHLVLGGVRIPFERGFVAHSDGDVLIHAVCDALLGAAALGDIGLHFPDTDPAFRGADSRVLLRETLERVAGAGWRPVNIDTTVIAQAPKLAPHVRAMRENLAADTALNIADVSVKATTTEHLGFTGRKEGVAAQAIVLLEPASGVMRV
ncbi:MULTISPECIES: 2-C-methyl-D-erythritol 2,4-cyclodiphosphate synthase [Thioalkalivibrio]|uniref:2-C-methyl-D-erythritol 2,4-cyclodiphosphate synthase n=1 Tax=Thioalkalivibrio versutus TaxID=106634 RepID=A0A0G3G457_9GAMM|nr:MULTISPECIES: 2-C-methyl-D-erythritol 2,4-cyclodiphosphate synthase [Thioalkalivibrio]AKJ95149.1 2-C-methyl-D-erythritol 2,4-cyclodiphosphate synthase [Thioalkalivibrio versutus]OOC50925.1 2-C-methyl-D-erythritol 2,4-cyclodiphosphate synthase [Thioalkalivibrio versutus]